MDNKKYEVKRVNGVLRLFINGKIDPDKDLEDLYLIENKESNLEDWQKKGLEALNEYSKNQFISKQRINRINKPEKPIEVIKQMDKAREARLIWENKKKENFELKQKIDLWNFNIRQLLEPGKEIDHLKNCLEGARAENNIDRVNKLIGRLEKRLAPVRDLELKIKDAENKIAILNIEIEAAKNMADKLELAVKKIF